MLVLRKRSLLREQQVGFRSGRSCIDHSFTPRQIRKRRQTTVVFLHIRVGLWSCLVRMEVPKKYGSIRGAISSQTTGRVRVYGGFSPTFSITSDVR